MTFGTFCAAEQSVFGVLEEKKRLQKIAALWLLPIVAAVLLVVAFHASDAVVLGGLIVAGISWLLCLGFYGASKGMPLFVGVLCGLVNPIGPLVLLIVPDQAKKLVPPPVTNYPRG